MFCYHIIGQYYKPQPIDSEGNPIGEPELYTHEGRSFHVNADGDIPEAWEQYEVFPSSDPIRKYATGDTRYFVFPDEASFRAVEPEPVDED